MAQSQTSADHTDPPQFDFTALPLDDQVVSHRWITWRSFFLGTLAVMLTSVLAPFNDYVLSNSFLIGSYFPPILALFFFALIVLVNAPLSRFAPSYRLQSGELGVIMAMLLVGCAVPTQGLLRSLIPVMVMPHHAAAQNPRFWDIFQGLNLPDWLYPAGLSPDSSRSNIVVDFYSRVQEGEPIPYGAWVVPLLGWGIFFGGFFLALLSLAILQRRQWAVNERLPFPITQLQIALIQTPRKGRWLNELLSRRSFWIAAFGVFAIQSLIALSRYFPRYVPEIQLEYDLNSILTQEPWRYLAGGIKKAKIYFTFIGIVYFIQGRIAFSLFAIYLIEQLINANLRWHGTEIPGGAWQDQKLGAAIALLIGVFWIGRHHWRKIIACTITWKRNPDDHAEYASYRLAFLTMLLGIAIMIGWLLVVGVTPWVAIVIAAFMLCCHLVAARIVAETGIPFIRAYMFPQQIFAHLPTTFFSGKDIYFSTIGEVTGTFTSRESIAAFGMHALNVHDATGPTKKQRYGLVGLLIWALLLAYVCSSAASLTYYYSYATPISTKVTTAVNSHLLEVVPRPYLIDPLTNWADGRSAPLTAESWFSVEGAPRARRRSCATRSCEDPSAIDDWRGQRPRMAVGKNGRG